MKLSLFQAAEWAAKFIMSGPHPLVEGIGKIVIAGLIVMSAPAPARAEPGVFEDRIVFGQAAALGGPAAALGQDMRMGLLAAFAEVNSAGGVNGRRLELVSRDDGYEPGKSIEATRHLINVESVFALVGAVGTPTSVATLPIATASGVPFIGAFTGAEFLRVPFKANVVNVRASYSQETETMIERLTVDRKVTRVAILYQDDAFGRSGLVGVQRALGRRGMAMVAEGTFERNTTAVKRALLAIRAGNPEAVIMIGAYRPCAAFIKLARQLEWRPLFVNISFVGSNALARELGPDGAGVIVTQVVPFPDDAAVPLIARYQRALRAVDRAAAPGFVTLEGYVVGRLVIAALERGPKDPTRERLLASIAEGNFDLQGISLNYSISDNSGSDKVYLTAIRRDRSVKAIGSLNAFDGKRPATRRPPQQKRAALSPGLRQ